MNIAKAHRPEFHLTCGLFWSFRFSVLRFFAPETQSTAAGCFAVLWAMQSASVHGCASSLALVRVPARSRGADRPWTPLRARLYGFSASPPARGAGGASGTVFGFSAGTGAGGVSGTGWGAGAAPEAGGASGMDCGGWAALLSAAGFRSGRFQLPSFPMRTLPHDLIIAPGILAALQIIGQLVHHASGHLLPVSMSAPARNLPDGAGPPAAGCRSSPVSSFSSGWEM